ncbi:protein SPO16 homolog [Styela clava]
MEPNCTPIVIHESLRDTDISRYFSTFRFKVKVSDRTEKNSIIFPKSSLAVIVYQIQGIVKDWAVGRKDSECIISSKPDISILDKTVLSTLSHFASVNRKSYVVLLAAKFDIHEMMVFTALQEYFMMSNLNILVAHNARECVECITTMGDATTKESILKTKETIDQISQEKSNSTDYIANALVCAGIDKDDANAIHRACGSLANIVLSGNKDYLLERTNLEDATAKHVIEFFGKNTIYH